MELFEVGNMVQIGDTLIPAVNIQVEGVPGLLKHCDGTFRWYGVYFEIMFEDGALWEVSQGAEQEDVTRIILTEYDEWFSKEAHDGEESRSKIFGDWERFLAHYEEKAKKRTDIILMHHTSDALLRGVC
jgi:hypothetical protein